MLPIAVASTGPAYRRYLFARNVCGEAAKVDVLYAAADEVNDLGLFAEQFFKRFDIVSVSHRKAFQNAERILTLGLRQRLTGLFEELVYL